MDAIKENPNQRVDYYALIEKYYPPGSKSQVMLLDHSHRVTEKALDIGNHLVHLNLDIRFIEEAAMLHDIGIYLTHAPELCCEGKYPYICHGYLGREILEKEGLAAHALVAERHVGVGITPEDIRKNNLPLPLRDMRPRTVEEQIIAYADKFFSKDCERVYKNNTLARIKANLSRHGQDKVAQFEKWAELFDLAN
jgi:uncharacterized protein